MRSVVKALNKKAASRNQSEHDQLFNYFKGVKCFTDLDISKNDLLKLIHCIKLQFVPKHEVLFRIGDQGQTFYVSLSGKCQLFVINPEQKALKFQIRDLQAELEEKQEQLEELLQQAI